MIEQVMRDPVSVGMLKIDGKRLMEVNGMNPGPRVGYILHALLEEVLENPDLNTPEHLEKKAQELNQLTDEDLKSLGQKGKEKMAEIEDEILREIKDRHKVQ
jgi:RecB family exonuclease